MTTPPRATATAHASVQGIAEQLAAVLGRPAAVEYDAVAVATGDIGSESDPQPPFELPVGDDAGARGRIVVATAGYPPLVARDFEIIDAAVVMVQRLLRTGAVHATTDRESVIADVLHDSAERRRAAFAAFARRWLPPGAGVTVRAVLVDPGVGELESIAFARHLGRSRPLPAAFAGRRAEMLYLVGPAADSGWDEAIRREGALRGIGVRGIGSASPADGADDLRPAADEAAIAATLAATMPEFHPAVDSRDLGAWLLLASTSADPADLRVISPAAHALYAGQDDGPRLTVETYLDVGANVVAACEILFVHRTTLYYRLERMPQPVREALADGVKRSTLHVALKLIRLWEATGRI